MTAKRAAASSVKTHAQSVGRTASAPPAPKVVVLLTKKEAAALLRCGERTLDRRVAEGLLPRVMLGGKVMFLREDLMAYIRANRGFGGKS